MGRFKFDAFQGPDRHVCSPPMRRGNFRPGSRAECKVCGCVWVLERRFDSWDGWYRTWVEESE